MYRKCTHLVQLKVCKTIHIIQATSLTGSRRRHIVNESVSTTHHYIAELLLHQIDFAQVHPIMLNSSAHKAERKRCTEITRTRRNETPLHAVRRSSRQSPSLD
jgi:hypothetical protein